MQIKRFVTPGLSTYSYFVFDENARRGVVIDPTRQIEFYMAAALKENVEITDIFETHVHADFISGAKELKAALHGKPTIHCSGMGGTEWTPIYTDHVVRDHDEVQVGEIRFEAVHTPGHTPEHVMWLAYDEKRSCSVPEVAFTGDVLFVGSIGRPDLLGEQQEETLARQLYKTLFGVLQPLPDLIEIYPAHGAGSMCGKGINSRDTSTLGYEKRCNPWFIPQDFEQWHRELQKGISEAPRFFQRMKSINVTGMQKRERPMTMPHPVTREQIREQYSHCLIVDTRNAEDFAARHLKGAVNVPFGHAFPLWAGIAIPDDVELVLVINSFGEALPVIEALRLIGLDHVVGVCAADKWSKDEQDLSFVSLPLIEPKQLHEEISQHYVLDVRTPSEWSTFHIPEAHHIELTKVLHSLDKLPRDRPIAVLCRSGARASLVASALVNAGFDRVSNLRGGIMAWENARLPLTKLEGN